MELDDITCATSDGVAHIELSRPEILNPISSRPGGTRDQIEWALRAAAHDPTVGAVVLTGAGGSFSAGGDLVGNPVRESAAEHTAFVAAAEAFHRKVRDCPLPIVAAVHGHCLGAAMSLIACCDIVLAAQSATFGLPEGRLGLVGATPLVPLIGAQWAKFLILTGEVIDAERARSLGLVLTIEPDDELRTRAADLARRIARLPREAVALNKRAIDSVVDASGAAAGRAAGAAADAVTLSNSGRATAPDGRTFREIITTEGIAGIKAARAAQFDEPWLPSAPAKEGTDKR
jgi:enoyl-CoA hydratase/carnithine racemase